jgi:Prefoldin subunit
MPALTAFQDETDPIETTFELNDTLYARANIPPTDEVHIWLGVCRLRASGVPHADGTQANVMLTYPIDEAEALLSTKLATAKTSLSNCEEDLDFLREQITVRGSGAVGQLWLMNMAQTMEVAIARVYNWEVVQKRKEKSEEVADKSKTKEIGSSPND